MIRLTLYLILASTFVFGQSKSNNRREDLFKHIIGMWEFRPGEFLLVTEDKRKINAQVDTWHTKAAIFNKNGDYTFIFRDSTKQFGKWDISKDGKILILSDMSDLPKELEELKEVKFPVKFKKGALHITYPLSFEKPSETPLDNILKPVYGNATVEIVYFKITG